MPGVPLDAGSTVVNKIGKRPSLYEASTLGGGELITPLPDEASALGGPSRLRLIGLNRSLGTLCIAGIEPLFLEGIMIVVGQMRFNWAYFSSLRKGN